jgi:hypothetical protein
VVDGIGLGRSCEAEDCGGQSASDDCGKSELLHLGAFFFVCLADVPSAGFVLPLRRSDRLNQQVRGLIPVAEIDRRLAVFNRFDVILPAGSAGIAQTAVRQ